jgi:hypothetical protein
MTQRGSRISRSDRGAWRHIDLADEAETGAPEANEGPAPDAGMVRDLQLEVALYIESIAAELRVMARAADLEALSYFLDMARIEASIQVERRTLSKFR